VGPCPFASPMPELPWPEGGTWCAHTQGVGVNQSGALSAEYIALADVSNIWRHSPTMCRDIAAIFDPFGNATHTALSFPGLRQRDVLITGAGPIGIIGRRPSRDTVPEPRHLVISDLNPLSPGALARKGGCDAGRESPPETLDRGGAE